MADTVQQVKERINIIDVVSPYVKLTRAGKYWKGLSPFNKEKTPSFFVSPDRGVYHCFSSGKGGDIFTFVEEMEGVDFKGALKILAEKAGVPLVYESPAAGDEKNRIYVALEAAKDFFIYEKNREPAVERYLTSRGLKPETIEAWSIGYASNEWRSLHDELTKNGFPENVLEKAGLIKKSEQAESSSQSAEVTANSKLPTANFRYYDRFRGRVMFPIKDISGRVIGFSGRLLEASPRGEATPQQQQAKYINSPETALFDKSRILYGLSKAREGIRSLGAAILVEGQLDLLMAHQAGYKNTIATSGTAFTESHAALIKRYTENLLIAYDGDRAGIAAAGRAAAISLTLGMNVKIAKFPPGSDPADLVLKNIDLFKSAVKEALHVVDFYIAHLTDAKYDPRTFKLEVSRTVLPFIAMIQNKIDQAHFVKNVAEVLSVPEDAVRAELSKVQRERMKGENREAEFPSSGIRPPASVSEPFLSRADTIERLVLGLMMFFRERTDAVRALEAEKALRSSVGDERFNTIAEAGDETRAALFEADFFLERHGDTARDDAVKEVYEDLARESRHEKYRETLAALRTAEKMHDSTQADELMQTLNRLASKLK